LLIDAAQSFRTGNGRRDQIQLSTFYEDVTFLNLTIYLDGYATRTSAARDQDMTIEKTMELKYDLQNVASKADFSFRRVYQRTYVELKSRSEKAWDAVYDPLRARFRKAKP